MTDRSVPKGGPNFLKQWREHRKITQEGLAALVEMSPPAISQIETGKNWFSAESLAKLSAALNCSPVELLTRDPSRTDSFWPLFEKVERLSSPDRERLRSVMLMFLAPPPGRPEGEQG